jgi:hypothetical protein
MVIVIKITPLVDAADNYERRGMFTIHIEREHGEKRSEQRCITRLSLASAVNEARKYECVMRIAENDAITCS